MHQIQILILLASGSILGSLKSRYVLVQLQDKSITHRNQDNGFLDRTGKIKSRVNGEDEVSPAIGSGDGSGDDGSGEGSRDGSGDGDKDGSGQDNPDVEVSELVNYGEYRWIKVPESFMSNWEKFHDPLIGSCASTEPLTNKKWILICKEVYWKIRIDLGKRDNFYINATKEEIIDNIPNIPPDSVKDLKCPSDLYSMTCALNWQHAFEQLAARLREPEAFAAAMAYCPYLDKRRIENDPNKCLEDNGKGFSPDSDCIDCSKPPKQKCANGYIMSSALISYGSKQCTKITCTKPDTWNEHAAQAEIEKFLTDFTNEFGPDSLEMFFDTQGRQVAYQLGGREKVAQVLSESKNIEEFGTGDFGAGLRLETSGLEQFRSVLNAVQDYNINAFRAMGFNNEQIGDVVEFFENSFFEHFLDQ